MVDDDDKELGFWTQIIFMAKSDPKWAFAYVVYSEPNPSSMSSI